MSETRSRSMQKRLAVQRGEPMPTFSGSSLVPDQRAEAESAVMPKSQVISGSLCVSVENARELLGDERLARLQADPIRKHGPQPGFIYAWNAADYVQYPDLRKDAAKEAEATPPDKLLLAAQKASHRILAHDYDELCRAVWGDADEHLQSETLERIAELQRLRDENARLKSELAEARRKLAAASITDDELERIEVAVSPSEVQEIVRHQFGE